MRNSRCTSIRHTISDAPFGVWPVYVADIDEISVWGRLENVLSSAVLNENMFTDWSTLELGLPSIPIGTVDAKGSSLSLHSD